MDVALRLSAAAWTPWRGVEAALLLSAAVWRRRGGSVEAAWGRRRNGVEAAWRLCVAVGEWGLRGAAPERQKDVLIVFLSCQCACFVLVD